MAHPIQVARAAQHYAARAAAAVGPRHHLARLLLAVAAIAAAAAWDAGHRVTDLHPRPARTTRRNGHVNAQEFRTRHGDPATWSPADIEAQQNLAAIGSLLTGTPPQPHPTPA